MFIQGHPEEPPEGNREGLVITDVAHLLRSEAALLLGEPSTLCVGQVFDGATNCSKLEQDVEQRQQQEQRYHCPSILCLLVVCIGLM